MLVWYSYHTKPSHLIELRGCITHTPDCLWRSHSFLKAVSLPKIYEEYLLNFGRSREYRLDPTRPKQVEGWSSMSTFTLISSSLFVVRMLGTVNVGFSSAPITKFARKKTPLTADTTDDNVTNLSSVREAHESTGECNRRSRIFSWNQSHLCRESKSGVFNDLWS